MKTTYEAPLLTLLLPTISPSTPLYQCACAQPQTKDQVINARACTRRQPEDEEQSFNFCRKIIVSIIFIKAAAEGARLHPPLLPLAPPQTPPPPIQSNNSKV